jgi:hypothetical protein
MPIASCVDATTDRPYAAPAAAVFRLDITKTLLALAAAVVFVQAMSLVGALSVLDAGFTRHTVVVDELSKLTKFLLKFDVAGEQTVGAWLSSILLMLCALVLLYIGTMRRQRGESYAWHWLGLSVIFIGLSMDEAVGIHEMTIKPLREMFGTSGIFLYAWVIPAMVFVALVGLAYLGFLRHLEPTFRVLFVLAGALFVGGALGFEMIEGELVDFYARHLLIYEAAIHLEDGLESAGELLFLFSLLRYALRHERELLIRLS